MNETFFDKVNTLNSNNKKFYKRQERRIFDE